MLRKLLVSLAFTLIACAGSGSVDPDEGPAQGAAALAGSIDPLSGVDHLYEVSPCPAPCTTTLEQPVPAGGTVYRSARPTTAEQLRYLHDKLGVDVIVNLEMIHSDETLDNGSSGIRFVRTIWDPLGSPDDAQIDDVISVLAKATPGHAVLVHCLAGRDRTGLVIALHRVLNEKWSAQQAYDEWTAHGFDATLVARVAFQGMFDYFVKRAGPVHRK
jgi:protein tyrosine/serine phosphatase